MLAHLKLGMGGQHLVMHAADPVPARADLAVRHGEQISAERRAEGFEHLLRRVEWNAPDQHQFAAHALAPLVYSFLA